MGANDLSAASKATAATASSAPANATSPNSGSTIINPLGDAKPLPNPNPKPGESLFGGRDPNWTLARAVGPGAVNLDTDVKKVQTGARAMGLYDGEIDGWFGPKTEMAVKDGQTMLGQQPDGRVNPLGPTQTAFERAQATNTLPVKKAPDTLAQRDPSLADQAAAIRQQKAEQGEATPKPQPQSVMPNAGLTPATAMNGLPKVPAVQAPVAKPQTSLPTPNLRHDRASEPLTGGPQVDKPNSEAAARRTGEATQTKRNPIQLSAATVSSNRRMADALAKRSGVGDLPRFTADALQRNPDQAAAELRHLTDLIAKRDPNQAQELVDRTLERLPTHMRDRFRFQEPSGDASAGASMTSGTDSPMPRENALMAAPSDVREATLLRARDPEAYDALPQAAKDKTEAYWMHRRGGTTGTYDAAQADLPENRRHAETAADAVAEPTDPEKVDWEAWTQEQAKAWGLSDEAATGAVVAIAASPVGSMAEFGQGILRARAAFGKGDIQAGLAHLGNAGLGAAKLKAVKTALDKGGNAALKALDNALPKLAGARMAKELAAKGLDGKAFEQGFKRAFDQGFEAPDAIAYGIFHSNADKAVKLALEKVGGSVKDGIGKLPPEIQERLFPLIQRELLGSINPYVKDLGQEAFDRTIHSAMDDISNFYFKPQT